MVAVVDVQDRTLKPRRFASGGKFRAEHPAARAFLAAQRERTDVSEPNKRAEFPKRPKRDYRGSENWRAVKPISTKGGPMILGERAGGPMLPGARSRRPRQNVWMPL